MCLKAEVLGRENASLFPVLFLLFDNHLFYLSTLLEDVTVSLVVVAGCPRLAVHVGHVMGGELPGE